MADIGMLAASEDLAKQLVECALKKNLSAMEILQKGMELVSYIVKLSVPQRKECVIAALEQLAKGADGIAGTADDLIPEDTLKMLEIMVQHNIIGDIIDAVFDASQGRLNIAAIKAAAEDTMIVSKGCYAFLCSSKQQKQKQQKQSSKAQL